MSNTALSSQKPAILGGAPLFENRHAITWPPTDEATALAMADLYRSSKWSWNGEWEQKAAQKLAEVHTSKHAMLLVNGTVTLEAALHAMGIGAGDEVIVPALTWLATAMAVLYVGATPVFVDVEPGTLCLDAAAVEAAITPRTKAVIPVHLYGGMADLDAIMAVARKHGLKVLEDCAHAQGGMWDGKGLGSVGDAGSFSFQQSKTISAGEGGGLVTQDDELADRLFRFKHIGYELGGRQGASKSGPPMGLDCHNYRATEFQGLAILPQLEGLEALTLRRNANADLLTKRLEAIPGLQVQKRGRKATPGRQSYYGLVLIFDPEIWGGIAPLSLAKAINEENLPTGPTYGPVYRHPLWNVDPKRYRIHGGWRDERGENCEVSEMIGTRRALTLMHYYLDLPEAELHKVADIFCKLFPHAALLK